MQKLRIGVFFGSRSAEHDVSIITALAAVIKPLERSGLYDIVPVYIAKNGAWYSHDKLKDISLYQSGNLEAFLQKEKPVSLLFDKGLTLIKPGIKNRNLAVDVAFPATHGTYGEDGSLMGVLRMANIPFVGCDLDASVIAMDKVLAKQVAEHEKIAVTKWTWCTKQIFTEHPKQVIAAANKLHYPLFVKPAHLGSSIGLSKVENEKQLHNALEVALHYDDKVIIEEGVKNLIEVTVPVIGNASPQAGLVERPLNTAANGVFDFEAKYMHQGKGKVGNGAKQGTQGYSELPAKLPKSLYEAAEKTALAVYRIIGCSGIARVDLLIESKTNVIYFNEINPLPGSLYAHNWRAAGVPPVELVTKLLQFAQDRYDAQRNLETSFSTNFLQQF